MSAHVATMAIIVGFGIPLTIIDMRVHRLPNRVVFAMGVTGALGMMVLGWQWRALIGAAAAFVFYAALAALPGQGMGMGDVKLAAVLGGLMSFIAVDALMIWLITPFVVGAIVTAALVMSKRATARTRIPFGPFMVLGAVVAVAATW